MERYRAYKDWLIRVKEDREFCISLFEHLTLYIMAYKYAYYIMDNPMVKDVTYDLGEKNWYMMGRGLKLLSKDETSPCVGFDYSHKYATLGIELWESIPEKNWGDNRKRLKKRRRK